MRHVLGVDGGGSKTLAVLMDEAGRVLGWAREGGSNHENIGFQGTDRVLGKAVCGALTSARIERPVDLAFWALAGADVPSDFTTLQAVVDRIAAAERNVVENDVRAVMGTGLSRGWGVGIVSGAGFNACGIAPDGRVLQFPALGEMTGDWGGGAVIGRETLRLAHRSYDGREVRSVLAERVAAALGMESFAELPERVRADSLEWDAIRDVLPRVLFAAAEEGDVLADQLVIRIGTEVGVTAATLIERLDMTSLDVEVVLGGSILRAAGSALIEAIEREVAERAPSAVLIRSPLPPAIGACFQALRTLGIEVNEETRDNVRMTLPEDAA